ncbi:MAG: hypothetical protein HON21_14150 [Gammaproteobacteria bacterium]|nr:hypothetical protein [Gammaproteobacteria bacterium]
MTVRRIDSILAILTNIMVRIAHMMGARHSNEVICREPVPPTSRTSHIKVL